MSAILRKPSPKISDSLKWDIEDECTEMVKANEPKSLKIFLDNFAPRKEKVRKFSDIDEQGVSLSYFSESLDNFNDSVSVIIDEEILAASIHLLDSTVKDHNSNEKSQFNNKFGLNKRKPRKWSDACNDIKKLSSSAVLNRLASNKIDADSD